MVYATEKNGAGRTTKVLTSTINRLETDTLRPDNENPLEE
jgi:hypothetical protein